MNGTANITSIGAVILAVNIAYSLNGAIKRGLKIEWRRMIGLFLVFVSGLILRSELSGKLALQIVFGAVALSAAALYVIGVFVDKTRRASNSTAHITLAFVGAIIFFGAIFLKISDSTGLIIPAGSTISKPVFYALLYICASALFTAESFIGIRFDSDEISSLLLCVYGGLTALVIVVFNAKVRQSFLLTFAAITLSVGATWWLGRYSKRHMRELLNDVQDGVSALREGRLPSTLTSTGGKTGDIAEVVGTLIWAVKNNQDELREKMIELEEKDKARREFLQNISHELRTPLMGVIGHADLLTAVETKRRSGAAKSFDEDIDRYIRRIEEEGRHLLNIINDLLEYSKADSGQLKIFPRRLDIGMTLAEVGRSVKPYARRNQIELKLETQEAFVNADPTRIAQAFSHIVNNALKFTPKGGKARLSVKAPGKNNEPVEIIVEDNGMGIPPDMLERVMKGFRQGDGSASREHGGLGVGLNLARSIIEAHGGTLKIDSKPGVGTKVTVTLPSVAAPSNKPDIPEIISGKFLLLCSSDRVLVEIIKENLKHTSISVGTVFRREDLLDVVRAKRPDVLLIYAPESELAAGGLIDNLKSNPRTSSIPKLLVVDENDGFEKDATVETLTRPFDRDQLVGMIKRCLNNPSPTDADSRADRVVKRGASDVA